MHIHNRISFIYSYNNTRVMEEQKPKSDKTQPSYDITKEEKTLAELMEEEPIEPLDEEEEEEEKAKEEKEVDEKIEQLKSDRGA